MATNFVPEQHSLQDISTYPSDIAKEQFAQLVRPQLANLLEAIGLDKVYERGLGDYLYYRDNSGNEQAVLDLVGGFGSSLLGHNHPALVKRAAQLHQQQRPFNAQGSCRAFAGLLAEKLSSVLKQATEEEFMATFANSGAEAVEAAIKHAELEAMARIKAIFSSFEKKLNSIKLGLRSGQMQLADDLLENSAKIFGLINLDGVEALAAEIYGYNRSVLFYPPQFWAVEGAFHGKKTGAMKLTHQREYREPWQRMGIQVEFLPREDLDVIKDKLNQSWIEYYDLEVDADNLVHFVKRKWCTVTACFVEPIQGEGGVIEISDRYWKGLREAADTGKFPLVIDEIQTGMGRTGRFIASRSSNTVGDYYLFSKTLGGGLAKLSAMMVKKSRYIDEFGSLHTSTFTDDDYSCAIALGVVELLTNDNHGLIRECHDKGLYLQYKLNELAGHFPDIVKQVRGRGLMVGIELHPPKNAKSPLLRVVADQGKFGYALCGYMLNVENVRLAPTLSAPNTLRIQPSAYIKTSEIDSFVEALERALTYVQQSNCYRLFGYMSGTTDFEEFDPSAIKLDRNEELVEETKLTDVRIAFLGHFLEPSDLLSWDPYLGPLSDDQCQTLLNKTRYIIEPFIVKQDLVYSTQERCAKVITYGIPATSKQYSDALKSGNTGWLQQLIEKSVSAAKRNGCSVVGFGGYNSIVTNNCTTLTEDQVALTTGNSLTSAAAIEAMMEALEQQQVELLKAKVGVVGSIGNIGKVVAEVIADRIPNLLLVGRKGSERRLNRVVDAILARAFHQVITDKENLDGVALIIANTDTVEKLRDCAVDKKVGAKLREGLIEELGDDMPIQVSSEFSDLTACDAIVSATNAAEPIIFPEHIGDITKVVCDVALPQDVDESILKECPDVLVLKGGLTKLGLEQQLTIPGMPHSDGYIFACLGETVLLGLAGIREHFSYGPLETSKVRAIASLAKMHGYSFTMKPASQDSPTIL